MVSARKRPSPRSAAPSTAGADARHGRARGPRSTASTSVAVVRSCSSESPSVCRAMRYATNVASEASRPPGSAIRSTRPRKPGRTRSVFGASARKNAGTPIVNVPTSVRWRGRNGYVTPLNTVAEREEQRVRGLDEEQARDPLDVVDHPPTLGEHRGQRRERAVEQHELGDRSAGLGAARHRDAAVGVLQGEHVVDAVAGHRDDVAARLQRLHHRPLLVRRHPPEHRRAVERVGELVLARSAAGGRRSASSAPCSPTRRPTAPTVRGLSPEITFSVTPCSAKYAERLGGVGAHLVLEHAPARRPRARRAGAPRRARVAGTRRAAAPACPRRRLASTAAAIGVVRVARRAPSRARRRPTCRGRRTTRRSTCGPTRTPPSRPASSPADPGTRRWSAACVAFGFGSDQASAASARLDVVASSRRRLERRRRRSTSIAPDVIVPVLSRQITSTRASTSIAGSSCTSVRRRARRTTPTVNATLVEQDQPLGHHRHDAADRRHQAVPDAFRRSRAG